MIFTDMVTEVCNRLNVTSAEGIARIGSYINQRYRRVTSACGLNTSRRTTKSTNTVNGTETITFALENIEVVYSLESNNRRIIYKLPYDELRIKNVENTQRGKPKEFAIATYGASSITIALAPVPDSAMTIYADGLDIASTLSGSDVPAFPADYHDVLFLGAMSDELFKKEAYELAKEFQRQYEDRLSDLKLFLAKSAYISPGETDNNGGLVTVVRRRWGP